jgi:hypothetical protein
VLARALPTSAEPAYGHRERRLRPVDVVEIAVAKLERRTPLTAAEEDLALLLADEMDRVDELVRDLEVSSQPVEERAMFWMFMGLDWLWQHRSEFDDALGVVELLYADLDYPEEISGLVRYMPAAPGAPTGVGAIEQRWRAYLRSAAERYRERDAVS